MHGEYALLCAENENIGGGNNDCQQKHVQSLAQPMSVVNMAPGLTVPGKPWIAKQS